MSLSSSAQHRPCAAPREALHAQLPGLGSALPPAPLELGRNAELRLPVILPASFRSGQCKMGPFSSGNASRLHSAAWQTSLQLFSPQAAFFCLQMGVGKDQL